MVQHPDFGMVTGEAAGMVSGFVGAPVVHDDDLPSEPVRQRLEMFDQPSERVEDDVGLVGLLPAPVTWTPGGELPFFRVTETPMAMPWPAPAGETVLTVDIGARVGDGTWTADTDALASRCLDALAAIIPDVHTRVIDVYSTRTPIAYPVFALSTEPARRTIAEHGIRGLVSAGRNAEFAHLLMEDVYWRTLRAMRRLGRHLAG